MNVRRALLALLVFSLFVAVFSSHDCLEYTVMEPKGNVRKFINRFMLVHYLTILWMVAVSIIARQDMQQSKKSAFQANDLKCSVLPVKMIQDILDDCKISKYDTTSEMKSKYHYATLYCVRRTEKQTATVLPLSLKRYFTDRQMNGNTEDLMKYEWARYRTFCSFPERSPARPIRLAANGFYYCGSGEDDSVRCFSCNRVYRGFKEDDIVSNVHSQISPNCPFLTGVDKSNIGIHSDEGNAIASGGSTDAGKNEDIEKYTQKPCEGSYDSVASSITRRNYRYPDFENFQCRMDTYSSWPCSSMLEPSVLADAGYFYAGFSDCVRCFSCGGGLRNWEYGDGPWEEHERWFPECLYLKERLQERKKRSREAFNEVKDTGIAKSELHTNENKTMMLEEQQTNQNNCFEENERLKNQLTCKICMDKASNVVFIPCGHMVSCEACSPHIRKCAICRKLIEGRIKAFMS